MPPELDACGVEPNLLADDLSPRPLHLRIRISDGFGGPLGPMRSRVTYALALLRAVVQSMDGDAATLPRHGVIVPCAG
jgi:hypothetical protein